GMSGVLICTKPFSSWAARSSCSTTCRSSVRRSYPTRHHQRVPDGTFKPDAPVTQAQFATMLQVAFQKPEQLSAIEFADIPSGYWAAPAIREAYEVGFLSGYPGGVFQPSQNIPASKC
ncbi:MAG: hypothetical protein BRC44_12605, partial [Cyanobacteria bacterium QS_4_48_99]